MPRGKPKREAAELRESMARGLSPEDAQRLGQEALATGQVCGDADLREMLAEIEQARGEITDGLDT